MRLPTMPIPQGSAIADLNERSREIFRHIVESYLATGEPVGSRNISRIIPMTLSPASVRNVMADLESAGLIYAPHTSAGRLPTELGLRFFVDALLEIGDLSAEERDRVEAQMRAAASGHTLETALAEASALLSGVSRGAGVVVTTKSNPALKHVEFVRLDPERSLVVLVSEDGSVENRLVDLPPGLPPAALAEASNFLNARIRGKTIAELKGEIQARRVEMEREDSGINVVLIEPSSMNTPLFDHARSKAGRRPVPIPPIYEPRVTAKAILHAAEHPVAIIATGGASKLFTAVERLNPRLLDWWQLRNDSGVSDQLGDEPDDGSDNLEQPIETAGSVTGRFGRESNASSVYTDLFELHPNRKAAVGLAALAGVLLAVRRLGR